MDTLRRVNIDGYTLHTYATNRTDWRGQSYIGYTFASPDGDVIFSGTDFVGSPMHADDSDETLRALLSFLTLRPGDTDRDYFDGYTERQIAFRDCDAEALSMWAMDDAPAFVDVEA